MRSLMMRLSLILAGVLLASPALAAGPYAKFSVGNWAGGAFTNNQTGDFSHCAVSASYKSGVTMHASLNGLRLESRILQPGLGVEAWRRRADGDGLRPQRHGPDQCQGGAAAARRRGDAGELQHRPRLPRRRIPRSQYARRALHLPPDLDRRDHAGAARLREGERQSEGRARHAGPRAR
jgi:hypothetical protein